MSFIDALLLDKVAYGFSSDREWKTGTVELKGGMVQHDSFWTRPKHFFTAPYTNLDKAQQDVVVAAFNATRGPAKRFRFWDRADFQLVDQQIGVADGTTDQQIQLVKTYGFDTEEEIRIITKPVDSTKNYGRGTRIFGAAPAYVITADDPLSSSRTPVSFTLDYLTGIVTLTATASYIVRATGWFDVPVYFEQQRLSFVISNRSSGGYVGSAVVELTEDWFV